ncbi:uncharacterized protein METZ01_LOCUS455579, partial [marine metagenome]
DRCWRKLLPRKPRNGTTRCGTTVH